MLHNDLQVDQSGHTCYDHVITTGLNDGCLEREPTGSIMELLVVLEVEKSGSKHKVVTLSPLNPSERGVVSYATYCQYNGML